MSEEETTLSRKDRKALRDVERKEKGKKRKRDEVDEPAQDGEPPTATAQKRQAPTEDEQDDHRSPTSNIAAPDVEYEAAAHIQLKKKRRRKAKSEAEKPSKNRFIVFVGNLPFKTTDTSLDKHFAKLKPYVLRHRTDPKTKKSKGFAFLEFENYDRMKTCLKLYHHSLFDPEAIDRGDSAIEPGTEIVPANVSSGRAGGGKKETARRINVELTAGGGGKTEGRKEKIKEKNVRLNEQRQRRAEVERVEKAKAEKEGRAAGGDKKGKKGGKEEAKARAGKKSVVQELQEKAVATDVALVAAGGHGIHPSRLARMQR